MTETLARLMSMFFFQIPLKTVGVGMEVMSRAFEGMQRITEQGAEELEKVAADGLGKVPEGASGLEYTPISNQGASREEVEIEEVPRSSEDVVDPIFVDQGTQTNVKEEKKMSCCDQDLSGCELKVVVYTIVNADPYIEDCHRVLAGPLTIATSDDLTDADFTAWVIAKYIQDYPDKVPHCEKQYLRVCYYVMCRLAMPCADYEKEQVDALRAINRTLREKNDDGRSGPPAKKPNK